MLRRAQHEWRSRPSTKDCTQDEGWARYTFEQLGIPYTSIHKDDARAGNLRQRFDVIVLPSTGGGLHGLLHEFDVKWSPLPYTRTNEYPSHGTPASTSDMTGGMGFQGLANLQDFVRGGGVLVLLEDAASLLESGFVRQLDTYGAGGLFHPGSVVRAKARRPDHPIMYGYPETLHLFRGRGPLFRTGLRDRGLIVLQYGLLYSDMGISSAHGTSRDYH